MKVFAENRPIGIYLGRDRKTRLARWAMVDQDDYEKIKGFVWSYYNIKGLEYAARTMMLDGKQSTVYMHRQIMGLSDARQIDHKNGDGLDNRKKNLRFATPSQNAKNKRHVRSHSSKYLGVSYDKLNKKNPWRASIFVDGKSIHLGNWPTPERAADEYDNYARFHHEEFAAPNNPYKTSRQMQIDAELIDPISAEMNSRQIPMEVPDEGSGIPVLSE